MRERLRAPVLMLGLLLLALALLLVVGAWRLSGDIDCEPEPGSSNFGSASWSWMPIGTACTWTRELNGFDRTEEPSWIPTLVVLGLVSSGLALVVASPRRRTPSTQSADPSAR